MNDMIELVVILDRSGSMQDRRGDHEGGLRSFVRDQRGLAGDVRLTFVRFDSVDRFEVVYDGARLAEVEEDKLTLVPRGGTPLLEAVGRAIGHVAERHRHDVPAPGMVIAMIVTDGLENSSGPDWTKARVKQLIAEREAAGWKVLYLGANVDAFAEAAGLGISCTTSLDYAQTPKGVHAMYASMSHNVMNARSAAFTGSSLADAYRNLSFTDQQRTDAKNKED